VARATRSGTRADSAVLAACVLVSLLAMVLPTAVRQSVAGGVRETVVGPLIRLQAQFERARGAFVTRDINAARLDSLALRNAELSDMARENAQLRALLGLGARLTTPFVPAEALHRPEMGDAHTVIVTAGRDAGVVERSAVVAPEGLIGLVSSVSPGTSTAILWTHPDFRVSAMSADGAAFGIIAPHLADPPARFLLELRGVAYRDSLFPGTPVVSSGLGSVFPRGIPIGTVISELETGEGWSRTYLVRPAVLPADVTVVMVLLPAASNDSDLSAIWRAPTEPDSAPATRRTADSLAATAPGRGPSPADSGRRPPR
jgi:rod shape-determining protein MreC